MMAFTATQFAILALVLVAGWLLGLASHPGGKKWRERYAAERDAHTANRKEADARLAAEKARQTELERENERLRNHVPVTAQGASGRASRLPRRRTPRLVRFRAAHFGLSYRAFNAACAAASRAIGTR